MVVALNAAQIPFAITKSDGEFMIEWELDLAGEAHTAFDVHTVVTPLFTEDELLEHDPDFGMLESLNVVNLERHVRLVIESLTGQSFGYSEGVINVRGNGYPVLTVPRRIIELRNLYPAGLNAPATNQYMTLNDGHHVEHLGKYFHGMNSWTTTGVISLHGTSSIFTDKISYAVDGKFGWYSPPDDIKFAALLLAGDFGCEESAWREKYIRAIRSGNWRIDFHSGAYVGTGNVSVDKILEKYTPVQMVVV